MKWLHLGYEYFACVDDNSYELVKQYVWRWHPAGYGRTHQGLFEKDTFLHELLMPERKEGQNIDHINRAKWDNRLENLRVVETWENQQNKGMPLYAPYPSRQEMDEAIEYRLNLKKSQTFLSDAAKRNQNWKKREENRTQRKVKDSQGNVFDSAVQAAKYYGAPYSSNILACIQGKKKTAYGQTWSYVD